VPHIVSISYRPAHVEQRPEDHYARIPLERATLIEGRGIEGDTKGCAKDRELNVMRAEAVAELQQEGFRTAPGELGEQLVIAGLDPAVLVPGVRLRLGEAAVIEVVSARTGCSRFAHIQGKPIKAAAGKMGIMVRVVCGGAIAVGAAVTVEDSRPDARCG
jgi:MOSC domain-containing protein YiiM